MRNSRHFVVAGLTELEFMGDITIPPELGGALIHIGTMFGLCLWAFGLTALGLCVGLDAVYALTVGHTAIGFVLAYQDYQKRSITGAPGMVGLMGSSGGVIRGMLLVSTVVLNINNFWGLLTFPWYYYALYFAGAWGPLKITESIRQDENGVTTPSVEVSA